MDQITLRYTGSTPGADSNDYVLFNSASAGLGAAMGIYGFSRLTLALKNSHTGTLKFYKSNSRTAGSNPEASAVTWSQIAENAVAAAAATSENVYDYLIEPYADVRLIWTNGGSAQTTWVVNMSLSLERGPAV